MIDRVHTSDLEPGPSLPPPPPKSCPLCDLKPGEKVDIASGRWCCLMASKTKENDLVLWAAADDYSDYFYPQYCPMCGTKVKMPKPIGLG